MSQLETMQSPTNSHGVKAAARKYTEWFESANKSDVIPRGKPPSRDKNAWRHNMANPRANDDVIDQTFANHPYAAKQVMIRARAPSPRSRRMKPSAAAHSETMSMASIQSEPAAGFHDLTKVNFSPHLNRKHFKIKTMNSSLENLTSSAHRSHTSRSRPQAFEFLSNANNPRQVRNLRMRSQSQDPPATELRDRASPPKSPKGPRRLESLETPPKSGKHLSLSFGLLDFEQNKISPIVGETKPRSNNLKGSIPEWMLSGPSLGSKSAASTGALQHKDPRFLEPIPPLQRSSTFDYGERKGRKDLPSWHNKAAASADARDKNPKPPIGDSRSRGRPSPKLTRRTQPHQSRELERLRAASKQNAGGEHQSRDHQSGTKKAITPSVYKHAQYVYSMDKIASEAACEPTPKPKILPDPKTDPIAKFAAQFSSNLPSGSRMSETSSLKDFELGQEMYTIAERSLENSRPGSEAGSTNSLEFLTSASMMNGVYTAYYNHDILALHDFPGRDQAPRKSILKKSGSMSTSSMYDLNRSLPAHAHSTMEDSIAQVAASNRMGGTDDQASMQSINTFTTDKKKVTWDF